MFNKNILNHIKENSLIISFSFLIILNQLNYFRIKVGDFIVFLPRALSLIFLIFFFYKIINILFDNLKIDKKNLIYFILFFFQVFLSLIFINEDFLSNKLTIRLFLTFNYEIIKFFFVYVFFCIIGAHLINKKNLLLVFKIILSLSYLVVFFGFVIFVIFHFTFFDLIERLFYYDDPSSVGYRFFSLFGEPRNAALFLITNISILILIYKNFEKKIKLELYPYFIFFVIFSLIGFFLTKSFSGILALFFGFVFVFLFFILQVIQKKKDFRFYLNFILFSFLVIGFLFLALQIDRVQDYANQLKFYIFANNEADDRLIAQFKDILPIVEYIKYLTNLEFKKILFGNGSYSSYYFNDFEFAPPHSFFTRLIYDNGLFGFFLFSLFVFSSLSKNCKFIDKVLLSFVYGAFLAINSTFIFTFIMFMICIKKNYNNHKNLINKI